MGIFTMIVMFVMSLSLLILIHELGHFLAARMFGVRVEKFYLFFNPWFSLFKFKIGETEFGIGWVPLGGYCKIAGMIDESMDLEQMKEPPKPYEFRSQAAWKRLLIMTGGVIMNLLLAVVIYAGLSFKWGDSYLANKDIAYGYVFGTIAHEAGFRDGDKILTVGGQEIGNYRMIWRSMIFDEAPAEVLRDGEVLTVTLTPAIIAKLINSKEEFMEPRIPFVIARAAPDSNAERAGIMAGDSLIALNGREMFFFDEFKREFAAHKGMTVELTVARNSAEGLIYRTIPIAVSDEGTIGVNPYSEFRFFPKSAKTYGLLASVPAGFKRAGTEINDYWKQLKLIVKPETEAYKSVGGFMTIASVFPNTWNWHQFWITTAFISIILAVVNILPIPALDGGHVMFLLWEVVTRRKPSDKFMEYAQVTGFLILLTLIIYANGNDIYRIFIKN